MKTSKLYFTLIMIILATSCRLDEKFEDIKPDDLMAQTKVPDGFNYQTANTITLTITDFKTTDENIIKYDIYLFDSNTDIKQVEIEEEDGKISKYNKIDMNFLNNKVASITSSNTTYSKQLVLPAANKQIYIKRQEMGLYSDHIVDIIDNMAILNRQSTGLKASTNNAATDIFYCVNGSGDVFTINQSTGELAIISQYPENSGSYNCALDTTNRIMYTTSRKSPNKLWHFNIDDLSWTDVGTFQSGPRMAYDHQAEEIYFSNNKDIWVLNPLNASILRTLNITNFVPSSSAGDIIFDIDGTTYISSTSGVFKGTVSDNTLDLTYISDASLPTFPTSLTIDSDRQLWWAGNYKVSGVTKGHMFIMDKETGAFEQRFDPYDIQINDLTTLPYKPEDVPNIDSDNDGIVDQYDEYPNDAIRATNEYTPSIFGKGTYAFEDLWPHKGDFDFNDLVINYKYIDVKNADDKVVETKMNFTIKHIGAGFRNGFGIELDIPESSIQMVNGYQLTGNNINLDGKGLETNQAKPVIIAFDDVKNTGTGGVAEIIISYNEPIASTNLNNVNPFIFVNQERGREVHLANKPPTSLGGLYLGTEDDASENEQYYLTNNNLPWAIDIIHDFAFPKEKVQIVKGYTKFAAWAESKGTSNLDWYKEHNRLSEFLY